MSETTVKDIEQVRQALQESEFREGKLTAHNAKLTREVAELKQKLATALENADNAALVAVGCKHLFLSLRTQVEELHALGNSEVVELEEFVNKALPLIDELKDALSPPPPNTGVRRLLKEKASGG